MADFEGDLRIGKEGMSAGHETMEVLEHKLLLVGGLRIVAFADIQDVLGHILLDYKPGTSAKA